MRVSGGGELVGRAPERARLAAALGAAAAGRPTVVVVDGEPGIGKTSLVRSALAGTPARTLAASGDEAEAELDWGVIDQVMRAAGTVPAPREGHADPAGAGAGLAAALRQLAADGLLAVVIDDTQWADPTSLRALTFAMRRLHDVPIVLCVTCRSEALDRMPAGLLARARSDGGRVTLGPLDRDAVAELAVRAYGQPLPAGAAERLRAHTGGNPLHTIGLLDELPFAVVAGRDALPAPRSFTVLVASRLVSCSAEARRLAGALAIVARGAAIEAVGAVADVADPGRAADELVAAGLAVRVETSGTRGEALSFAHALVRASIRDDLSPSRLADLHRRAAGVTSGDDSLRHRLAAAHGPDAALVAAACERAACLADTGSPGAAARLRLAAAAAATPAAREELILAAAVELMQAGEPLGRLAGCVEAFADSARRSLALGREALRGGRRAEAGAWLERAWRQSSDDPTVAALAPPIADMLAMAALDQGRWDETRAWAERAVARGSTSGISATLLAHGLVLTRDGAAAERRMSRLLDGAASRPVLALDARVGRGVARLWANDLDGAVDDLRAAAAHLGRIGSLVAQAEVDAYLAEAALRGGRWAEAVAQATAAAGVVDDADAVWLGALAHGVVVFVRAAQGDIAGADRHAAMAAASARASGLMAAGLWAHHAAMRLAVASGDHAEVARLGDRMAHEPWVDVPEGVHHWRASYVESLVAVDRVDDAARVARDLDDEARGAGDESIAADAARACGTVASARRRDDAATSAFARGLALDVARSRPFERARLELAAGAHLRRTGRRRAAADLLATAARRLRALGATPWADRCAREIDACGLRPRRRDGAGTGLTARERLVAGVVARGLSNREVAAELGISAKTVEHHLSRIYAKLGVASRSQLAVHVAAGAEVERRPAPAAR